jgi:ribonuclease BN (tRNA processing enzyme)
MRLKFLGSGGSFVRENENYHSNIILYLNNKTILIDAGYDIKNSLGAYDVNLDEIDAIFITHLHGDHCGGVEFLGFKTLFYQNSKKKLISTKEILKKGWKNMWSGTMQFTNKGIKQLNDYFYVEHLKKDYFIFDDIKFILKSNKHIYTKNYQLPSYGLIFKNKKRVYISGDTIFQEDFLNSLTEYDYIFHEVVFKKRSDVHTTFKHLKTLKKDIRKKIWLYHYTLNNYQFSELNKKVKKAGFQGLIKRGMEFEF